MTMEAATRASGRTIGGMERERGPGQMAANMKVTGRMTINMGKAHTGGPMETSSKEDGLTVNKMERELIDMLTGRLRKETT